MKYLIVSTILLIVVSSHLTQSAPIMNGCKRWKVCPIMPKPQPKIKEDLPPDMAKHCKYFLSNVQLLNVRSFLVV
jgi:hypothetical protein